MIQTKISTLFVCMMLLLASAPTTHATTYCVQNFYYGCYYGSIVRYDINTFKLNGVSGTAINDTNTGCVGYGGPGYDDRTSKTVTLQDASTYTVSINTTRADTVACVQVYIDFNDDGDFDDYDECVGGMNGVATKPAISVFTITIPYLAPLGSHRMRVLLTSLGGSCPGYPWIYPCPTSSTYFEGESHDYTIVMAYTPCNPASTLTTGAITSNSAVINWTTATSSVVGSQVAIGVTSSIPTSITAQMTATTYTFTGLTPATSYYAQVRDSCGIGRFSSWLVVNFTTAPTGINDLTNDGFNITLWPNPVKNMVSVAINGTNYDNATVLVMDLSGKVLQRTAINSGSTAINMNNYPSGIYLVRYIDDVRTRTMRLCKE